MGGWPRQTPTTSTRKRSALSRLSNPATLRAFVDRLHEGIYITNRSGLILDANPTFLDMMGVGSIRELRAYRASDFLVDPDQRTRELRVLSRRKAVREFELQLRRPDGSVGTFLDTAYAVKDEITGEILYHGILVDISKIKDLEHQLRAQALRDPLTGCYNRRHLAALASELDPGPTPWAVAVIDIDHFKQYNDQLGHQAGDATLCRTAAFLGRQIRSEDTVCRIGGDEFLLVMIGIDKETAAGIIARLTENARCKAPVPFSLGWAVRRRREKLETTIGRADGELIGVRVEQRRFRLRQHDPD